MSITHFGVKFMGKSIFAELRSSQEFLTRVERTIAQIILEQPRRFVSCTMAELAAELDVSQGSINNFARKFSGGGFSELKLRVAAGIPAYEEQDRGEVDVRNVKAAMSRRAERAAQMFSATLELNDEQTMQRVVRRILGAKKIAIYGVFHSGIVARDFCYRLIQLGIPATFVEDTLMCAVSASMLDENALVIAISASGRTSDIIDAVEIAKKNGVPVVCLTSNRFSPLTKLAEEVLLCAYGNYDGVDGVGETRMAQLFVLDTLCSRLFELVDTNDRKQHEKLLKIISSHSIQD